MRRVSSADIVGPSVRTFEAHQISISGRMSERREEVASRSLGRARKSYGEFALIFSSSDMLTQLDGDRFSLCSLDNILFAFAAARLSYALQRTFSFAREVLTPSRTSSVAFTTKEIALASARLSSLSFLLICRLKERDSFE